MDKPEFIGLQFSILIRGQKETLPAIQEQLSQLLNQSLQGLAGTFEQEFTVKGKNEVMTVTFCSFVPASPIFKEQISSV